MLAAQARRCDGCFGASRHQGPSSRDSAGHGSAPPAGGVRPSAWWASPGSANPGSPTSSATISACRSSPGGAAQPYARGAAYFAVRPLLRQLAALAPDDDLATAREALHRRLWDLAPELASFVPDVLPVLGTSCETLAMLRDAPADGRRDRVQDAVVAWVTAECRRAPRRGRARQALPAGPSPGAEAGRGVRRGDLAQLERRGLLDRHAGGGSPVSTSTTSSPRKLPTAPCSRPTARPATAAPPRPSSRSIGAGPRRCAISSPITGPGATGRWPPCPI
jgi:hypothetical protein